MQGGRRVLCLGAGAFIGGTNRLGTGQSAQRATAINKRLRVVVMELSSVVIITRGYMSGYVRRIVPTPAALSPA